MNPSPIDRRTAIRVLLSGAGVALLTACTAAPASPTPVPTIVPTKPTAAPPQPTPPPPTVAVATSAKPAAAAAKSGGTLRLGMVGDISTLDGHNTTPNQFDTTWSVFDRLISYDAKLQPQPELAESWDLSSDLTQIKLNLRKGRAVALRSRVHQRRRQVQPAARPRREAPDSHAAQPEQLVHDHRHAGQIHDRPQVGPAAAGDVRLLRVLQPGRPADNGRAERQDRLDRHRTVQVRRVGPGRPPDLRAQSELLEERSTILSTRSSPRPRDAQAMLVQLEAGRARRGQGSGAERLRALPRRLGLPDRSSIPSAATTSCSG